MERKAEKVMKWKIASTSTGGAVMKAIINVEVVVNKVGIIKASSHLM